MPSYSITTYGCSNNQAESEIMEALLRKKGFSAAPAEQADIVILNTCSVKNVTENKILHAARELQTSNKKFILTGCMPEAQYDVVKEVVPEAGIVSTHHIDKIGEAAESMLNGEYVEILGKARPVKASLPKIRKNPVIDIIPISSGCKSFCTFCSTKLAKGDLFSYPTEIIVDAVKKAITEGVKEFWLTSQDNGCYGCDRNKDITDLINEITSNADGDYMLRIGMMNPEHVVKLLPKLLEAYENEHVFKFFHLPVQSGSDQILKKMKRRHTAEDYVKIVEEIRSKFLLSTIWTDMICGFPEETEKDFQMSMKLLERTQPDFSNVSAYGNRPNTLAARMKQLDTAVKKERTRRMSDFVRGMSERQNKKWVGWSGKIIIDEFNTVKQTWIGRNFAYKSVVVKGNYSLGQSIDVKITDAAVSNLMA
ncbi:MAG: tRNA (N(6)-L-threonylcarbamoyladenosine(37)-C(2))-methylthiotransferase [Candidatus Aenigmarchaeota archaeon]|nr:tRNA (N(6)-L-threonylcarbamoyladenosine(37)-C(2))-methylthiotransferase [Candidatus Aenigmarchaeota archaeon]